MKEANARLRKLGRKLVDVAPDGSCFYHAVAHQINMRFPQFQEEDDKGNKIRCEEKHVRSRAADWLRFGLRPDKNGKFDIRKEASAKSRDAIEEFVLSQGFGEGAARYHGVEGWNKLVKEIGGNPPRLSVCRWR
jgi:hypothetical protein